MPRPLRGGGPGRRHGARTTCPIVIAGGVDGPGRRARPRTTACWAPPARSTSGTSRTTARSRSGRSASRRPTSGSTRPSPGPRSASTRGWRRTRCSAPGFVAGFRTSGESERPGFAWLFGRDALWTALAIDCLRRLRDERATALEFLRKFQRADGKIPHEVSQSASLVPWFTDYKYPWASADATPLYVIAQADHWRAHRRRASTCARAWAVDREGLALHGGHRHATATGWSRTRRSATAGWRAARSTRRTRRSTCRASGSRPAARLGRAGGGDARRRSWPATRARWAERTRDRGREDVLAAATVASTRSRPRWPKPRSRTTRSRDRAARARQARIDALRGTHARGRGHRAARGAAVVADARRGARAVADRPPRQRARSPPTGARGSSRTAASSTTRCRTTTARSGRCSRAGPSVGAYRYGRPHVGYQALMANALLTYQGALGLRDGAALRRLQRAVRPLVAPPGLVGGDGGARRVVRGLLGHRGRRRRRTRLTFAPQLPGGLGPRGRCATWSLGAGALRPRARAARGRAARCAVDRAAGRGDARRVALAGTRARRSTRG